jgi:Mrp family chromosome partitioning ATPase
MQGGGAPEGASPAGPPSFSTAAGTKIGKTLVVMSGKGGVGKSAVATLIAAELHRRGSKVGILDADITGPSIPRGLGITGRITVGPDGVIPAESYGGLKVMSMNLVLPSEDDAVIWRGPLVSGAVKQFYEECDWGELDYLVIDLPPGTSDVPLTIMQSIPLDGIILVTSPQQLAGVIVAKARKMAATLNAPVLGLVENMSFVTCPSCGEKVTPFAESHGDEVAVAMDIPFLGRLPLDPEISRLADAGKLEEYRSEAVEAVLDNVLEENTQV